MMEHFPAESEEERHQEYQEWAGTLDALEAMVEEIRTIVGYRRTLLKNADKTLQEFQDTISAMVMAEEFVRKDWTAEPPFPEEDDPDAGG
ncbi:hypothetical protein GF339_02675 [candidate division KSB3 bacterium]|uniref:Uncharacterized protein n=1 Tax=candidate division KSB3 bacterium TaxID=2044937 RepID=A0A9D5Q484_9BACT|nr:hypothetical protein [candidate division KSB3 bacterium]MBD3323459.1 hypothetical protein [candidate division KSB3 bacterium]